MLETVMVVDDEEAVLSALCRLLRSTGYRILTARSAEEGLKAFQTDTIGLVISDSIMPGTTGIQFLSQVRERWPDTVRIMLTGCADLGTAQEAINAGVVHRFVTKPWNPESLRILVRQGLDQYHLAQENRRMQMKAQEQNESLQRIVEQRTEEIRRKNTELQQLCAQLKGSFLGTVEAMAMMVEVRDPYTAGHQRRVSRQASLIAEVMGLAGDDVDGIRIAAALHDLGKIAVPAEILSKPGKLSGPEFALIKNHPCVAYDILKPIQLPWPIAPMVVQHHERMDGSGYPAGLSGHEILLGARIIAIADVVDAMSSHRPYRPAIPMYRVVQEIRHKRGSLYDPDVVDAWLTILDKEAFQK